MRDFFNWLTWYPPFWVYVLFMVTAVGGIFGSAILLLVMAAWYTEVTVITLAISFVLAWVLVYFKYKQERK